METIKICYDISIEHSKYVADIIGSNPMIKNKIMDPITKLFNDDTMCQSLEPLPSFGLFSKGNIVKFVGMSGGFFIVYRGTKSLLSELNQRYLGVKHWFAVYEWSLTHPELYLLIELHSLVSPAIYFHYMFKLSWSILRSYHMKTMHSTDNNNYKISKWKTLLKVSGILAGSCLYWFSFTDWSAKQLFSRNLSFHSWVTKRALQSIDIEEVRWKKAVYIILSQHFQQINELSNIVIELVGDSHVFLTKQNLMRRSMALSNYNYSCDRRREYRRKYTRKFKKNKIFMSCLVLSAQSIAYLLLLYKTIKCQDKQCEKYYDKLHDLHQQFDDKYEYGKNEEWRIHRWIHKITTKTFKYLFIDDRIPFSRYIISITDYVSSITNMNRNTKRFWRNVTFCGSLFLVWTWLNYAIVEGMIYIL